LTLLILQEKEARIDLMILRKNEEEKRLAEEKERVVRQRRTQGLNVLQD